MLRRALDFWMESPASYSPIIVKGRSASSVSETFDDQNQNEKKDSNTKSTTEVTIIRNPISNKYNDICWFALPEQELSFQFFFSIRGSENFHLYLWLIKDLAWAQSWYYCGHIFGSLAVIWATYILSHAVRERNTNEVFTGVAQTFWLMANVWWMTGDLHDHQYPDDATWYTPRTIESGHMMQAALCWLGVYYLIVKPFRLLGCDDPEALKHYDNTGLKPRFSRLFSTWREYENCHILFWLGKDCAWNGLIRSMWIIFVVPTILIAVDFAFTSLRSKKLLVDHAHYFSQLLWVLANAIWAGGELYDLEHDTPYPLIDAPSGAYVTLRWYSSWVLIIACTPVLAMYGLWIYYTVTGKIEKRLFTPAHQRSSDQHEIERSDSDCNHEGAIYNIQPMNIQPNTQNNQNNQNNSNQYNQNLLKPNGVTTVTNINTNTHTLTIKSDYNNYTHGINVKIPNTNGNTFKHSSTHSSRDDEEGKSENGSYEKIDENGIHGNGQYGNNINNGSGGSNGSGGNNGGSGGSGGNNGERKKSFGHPSPYQIVSQMTKSGGSTCSTSSNSSGICNISDIIDLQKGCIEYVENPLSSSLLPSSSSSLLPKDTPGGSRQDAVKESKGYSYIAPSLPINTPSNNDNNNKNNSNTIKSKSNNNSNNNISPSMSTSITSNSSYPSNSSDNANTHLMTAHFVTVVNSESGGDGEFQAMEL